MDVRDLVGNVRQIVLTGDPMSDWRLVRAALADSPREELQHVAREARHLRLLQRGAQIERQLAEAWRANGAYRDAREHLAAAVVEDQFAATTRPHHGVTVRTIHKSKGKEFDESSSSRVSTSATCQREAATASASPVPISMWRPRARSAALF
ncbi:hypothetical protein [Methylorubrum salsuginis]|uniref:hypothetical protein n=1 Tax=Methylorubrum salsuginis TaxID=414703 RepID=UPI000B2F5F25|nr:hypothetical protein [Methylorubrum salsuginis]